jgi:hypothetical protein
MNTEAERDLSEDIYREKYVAFVDLLGFKRLVADADQSQERRRHVHEVLELLRETACENPSIGMRLTQFSDCIIMSADRTATCRPDDPDSPDLTESHPTSPAPSRKRQVAVMIVQVGAALRLLVIRRAGSTPGASTF